MNTLAIAGMRWEIKEELEWCESMAQLGKKLLHFKVSWGRQSCPDGAEAFVSVKVKDDWPLEVKASSQVHALSTCPAASYCHKDTRFPNPAEQRQEAIILKKVHSASNPFSQLVYHLQSLR